MTRFRRPSEHSAYAMSESALSVHMSLVCSFSVALFQLVRLISPCCPSRHGPGPSPPTSTLQTWTMVCQLSRNSEVRLPALPSDSDEVVDCGRFFSSPLSSTSNLKSDSVLTFCQGFYILANGFKL